MLKFKTRMDALKRAAASHHDPTSRRTSDAGAVDASQPHHPVDRYYTEWCIDPLCPVNRASEELHSLGIR